MNKPNPTSGRLTYGQRVQSHHSGVALQLEDKSYFKVALKHQKCIEVYNREGEVAYRDYCQRHEIHSVSFH